MFEGKEPNKNTSKTIVEQYVQSINKDKPFRTDYSLLNIFFHHYTNKIIKHKKQKNQKLSFDFNNLYKPPDALTHKGTHEKFLQFFLKDSKPSQKKSFFNSINSYFGWPFLVLKIQMASVFIVQLAIPFVLRQFLGWINEEDPSIEMGVIYSILLIIIVLCRPLIFHSGFYQMNMATLQLQMLVKVKNIF